MPEVTCQECGLSTGAHSPPLVPSVCPRCAAKLDLPPRRSSPQGGGVAEALALARGELGMEVAILGEITGGRELVRRFDGDAGSFDLREGASLPVAESYCHHVLEGRVSGVIPDARADRIVGPLKVTAAARIGSYIGVPLEASDARLYMLCCLAHESRPTLRAEDLRFMRGVGETVLAALEREQG